MRTRLRFADGVSSGVMMSARTPPMVVSSTLTGKRRLASADCFARHSSVRLRRISRVSGAAFEPSSDWSHFRASGLMVAGMGTTRVMCAVPSESKVAESAAGELVAEGFVAAHPARRNARNRDKEGSGRCIGTSKSGINARRSQKPRQLTCSAPSVLHPANTARYV